MKKMTPEQRLLKIAEINKKVKELNKEIKNLRVRYDELFKLNKEAKDIKSLRKKTLITSLCSSAALAGGVALIGFTSGFGLGAGVTLTATSAGVITVAREMNKSAAVDDVILQMEIQKKFPEIIDEHENFDNSVEMSEEGLRRLYKNIDGKIKEKYGYQQQRDELKESLRQYKFEEEQPKIKKPVLKQTEPTAQQDAEQE